MENKAWFMSQRRNALNGRFIIHKICISFDSFVGFLWNWKHSLKITSPSFTLINITQTQTLILSILIIYPWCPTAHYFLHNFNHLCINKVCICTLIRFISFQSIRNITDTKLFCTKNGSLENPFHLNVFSCFQPGWRIACSSTLEWIP